MTWASIRGKACLFTASTRWICTNMLSSTMVILDRSGSLGPAPSLAQTAGSVSA